MKTALWSFLIASASCWMISFLSPEVPGGHSWHAQGEGYGVNPGSRKYWEYLRHATPDGTIPAHMRNDMMHFASRLPRKPETRDAQWTARGPFNKGGRTRAFAMDVLNENHLLAGGVTGGMWSSLDAGQSWTKTTAPGQIHSVSCLTQDKRPGHESTWYFGTGEEFYGVVSGTSFTSLFSGDGIFKSVDNGATWEQIESTASGTPQTILDGTYDFVWNMALDHTSAEQTILYAAVFNGIIRSVDGGDTWEEVLGFTGTPSTFSDIMITPTGVLYATLSNNPVNGGGCFRSTDGINWVKISPAIANLRRIVMTHNPLNENEVYFLGETLNNPNYDLDHFIAKYTYVSGNGTGLGGLWDNRSANLPDEPCELFIGANFDFATFRSQFSYDLCIAHHPTTSTLFIGGININRSASAFAQDDNDWIGGYRCNIENPIDYSYPNHHSDQHWFFFHPTNPNIMFNANDGGVYRTDNCLADSVSWVPLNNGFRTTQYYTVAFEQGQATSDFVFGGTQDNGTWISASPDPTAIWKEVHADDGSYCAMPEGRAFTISSSQQGRVQKKLLAPDGTLLGTERIDPANAPNYLFINPFILDPWNHNDLYVAGNKSILFYNNVDAIPVTNNYTMPLETGWATVPQSTIITTAGTITTLDKALINNNTLYYGTTQGKAFRLENCFDPSPTRVSIGIPEWNGGYISCISANDLNEQELVMSLSNYGRKSIYHSMDGGGNWTHISGNLEENVDGSGAGPAVYWVEIYPSDPPIYFAGTSAGLFSTELLDGDNTVWEMEGANNIGNVVVNMVKVRPYDGKVAVGTHGNGIYSASLPPVAAAGVLTPVSAEGKPAFPNPFSDRISIHCLIKKPGLSTIEIFDLSGKKVDSVQLQTHQAGWQTMQWTPHAGTPPGTYLYRWNTNGQMQTGKLIYE
jgi:uncharacterized protein YciU (UPF0263 family)